MCTMLLQHSGHKDYGFYNQKGLEKVQKDERVFLVENIDSGNITSYNVQLYS